MKVEENVELAEGSGGVKRPVAQGDDGLGLKNK